MKQLAFCSSIVLERKWVWGYLGLGGRVSQKEEERIIILEGKYNV